MITRRRFLETVGVAAASAVVASARDIYAAPAPKPYTLGVAPSHITTPPGPLFAPDAPWPTLRGAIDFYKLYAVQLSPQKWTRFTRIDPGPFVECMKKNKIAIASEFGAFGPLTADGGAETAAQRVFDQHKPLIDAGGQVDSLHLDGPDRQMLRCEKGKSDGPALPEIAGILAGFFQRVHAAWPRTKIGLISNFPNWDYTRQLPGFNGHYTRNSGVTYHQAVEAFHAALTRVNEKIAFISLDCPFNYYTATKTRADKAPMDCAASFRALQKWCRERGIGFNLIINFDIAIPPDATLDDEKQSAADRKFHDGTLDYIRRLHADGIRPDEFLIQSWYRAPREHLPEDMPFTFTHTAREAVELIRKLYK